jgi:hypothetical protein
MSVALAPDDVARAHARGAPNQRARSRCRRVAIGLALVLCGCGSTALSDGQLRSRATSLCLQGTRQTGRIPAPASPAEAGAFFARGAAVLAPELTGLAALHPPSSAAAVYATALSGFRGKLTALREAVRHLARGEDPVIATKTLQQKLGRLELEENRAWRALGIPACINR